MKIAKIPLHCFLLIALINLPVCQAAPPALPSSVDDIDKDMKALDDLFGALLKIPSDDKDTLFWLNEKVYALPPLFRYELARRFNVTGHRELALIELAGARLGRDMDAAECLKKDRSTPWDVWITFTNSLETSILNSPRLDKNLWHKSISSALEFQANRDAAHWKKTSALWLCGPNNMKDAQSASASRKSVFEFMKADFEKLNSAVNEKIR